MGPTGETARPKWSFFSFWANREDASRWVGVNKKSVHYLEDPDENGNNYQRSDYWTHEGEIENEQQPSPMSSSSSCSSTKSLGSGLSRRGQKAATICACFLKDYEGGRPPTLSSNFSGITRRQLLLYRVKHSFRWKIFGLLFATILLFIPSFRGRLSTLLLHTYSILVFAIDMYMKEQFFEGNTSRPRRLLFDCTRGFLFMMSLQTITNFLFPQDSVVHAFTLAVSVFKPIVFFYRSRRARDALEAIIRISKKLLRVILIEMFLILIFAAVACRLYYNHESFQSLPQAWLSLFACECVRHKLAQILQIIWHLVIFCLLTTDYL